MLKIKDNVDLKELENYGFEITKNNWERLGEDCFEAIKKEGGECNIYETIVHGREISIYSEIKTYKYFDLETIYDLIVDGLVEKV